MITSVTKKNIGLYRALFSKANAALELEGSDQINTLEEYFINLEELAKKDLNFTILPADEEFFEINANTREIIIPEHVRRNGIAVQGDQAAEIVYFKINRFFDFTDLNNTTIFIQWRRGEVQGVSNFWIKDIESNPDYLVFGWPLDNKITEEAGQLNFSIRFVQFDDNKKIVFSMSTLEASAIVNSTLNLPSEELVVDSNINQMIFDRLFYGKIENGGSEGGLPTSAPEIIIDLPSTTELENGERELIFQANSTDGRNIKEYQWFCDNMSRDGKIEYVLTEDKEYIGSKTYYYKNKNGIYIEETRIKTEGVKIDSLGYELYEQRTSYVAKNAGDYYVKTIMSDSTSYASKHTYIPGEPNFSTFVIDSGDEFQFADGKWRTGLIVKYEQDYSAATVEGLPEFLENKAQWFKITDEGRQLIGTSEINPDGYTFFTLEESVLDGSETYCCIAQASRNKATWEVLSEDIRPGYSDCKRKLTIDETSNVVTANLIFEPYNYFDGQDYKTYQWFIDGNCVKSDDFYGQIFLGDYLSNDYRLHDVYCVLAYSTYIAPIYEEIQSNTLQVQLY